MKQATVKLMASCLVFLFDAPSLLAEEPLPSWNDGPAKQSIIAFVSSVTDKASDHYIPAAERVAVFDNDGTLWPENPIPIQLAFALDRLQVLTEKNPDLRDDPLIKAALAGDMKPLLSDSYRGLLKVIAITHANATVEDFAAEVESWISHAKHPNFDRPYDQCAYQPMRELLAYLRANQFKTFIVSGGGADFMRVWCERVYGVQPQQCVGSYAAVDFEFRDGQPMLTKRLDHLFIDDKEGKPKAIYRFIGRRPVLAVGNSDGDKAMLEYTTIGNPLPSLGVLIHHTDSKREFSYDAHPKSSGKLVEALEDADMRGWSVVDMSRDWDTVFSDNSVTAIDILLEPDEVMLQRAAEVNTRLLENYPQGFMLDSTHRPHITLIQRFVSTNRLPEVYSAARKVLARYDLKSIRLRAFKHYYIPDGEQGLAGIVIETTEELRNLQAELLEAVKPFTVPTGSSSAFVTTPDDLVINPFLIQYVEKFDTIAAGENFNPHVTTGVGTKAFLENMLTEEFDEFTHTAPTAAVYQLGQYGTAAKKLEQLTE